MLSSKSRLMKVGRVPWRIIEGEAILVNVDDGKVIHLNPSAAEIWALIDGKRVVEEIVGGIQRRFEVDEKTAEGDVLEFVEELLNKGLVECQPKER